MRWVVEKLKTEETVTFRLKGNSMHPIIKNGQQVTVKVHDGSFVEPGTVVLCSVAGNIYLHKVVGFRKVGNLIQYRIGNNRGHINGWTSIIYAVLSKVG